MCEIHPYKPYIPDEATKLIIGSIPPYRFCVQKDIQDNDVRFYYGSNKNYFWKLLSEVTDKKLDFKNTEEAINQRKEFLKEHNIGITDIIESCIHKDGKSDDKSLEDIKYQPIDKLLHHHPKIDTLICTSNFVKSKLNIFADVKYRESKENPRNGSIIINDKKYHVIILYSPSPLALLGMGTDGASKRMAQYTSIFKY